jgi:selenocysteine lyase/cysteine desulfurase
MYFQLFVDCCQKNPNIKIAIVDHISSCSAIMFPVKEITEALHKLGILVLIDGAHGPGQVPDLQLDDLGADFYTGTLHKWAYATKGTALLWVAPKHQNWVRPLIKSHNYKKSFQEEFFQQVKS